MIPLLPSWLQTLPRDSTSVSSFKPHWKKIRRWNQKAVILLLVISSTCIPFKDTKLKPSKWKPNKYKKKWKGEKMLVIGRPKNSTFALYFASGVLLCFTIELLAITLWNRQIPSTGACSVLMKIITKKGYSQGQVYKKQFILFHPVKLILHAGSFALLQTLILWVGN